MNNAHQHEQGYSLVSNMIAMLVGVTIALAASMNTIAAIRNNALNSMRAEAVGVANHAIALQRAAHAKTVSRGSQGRFQWIVTPSVAGNKIVYHAEVTWMTGTRTHQVSVVREAAI